MSTNTESKCRVQNEFAEYECVTENVTYDDFEEFRSESLKDIPNLLNKAYDADLIIEEVVKMLHLGRAGAPLTAEDLEHLYEVTTTYQDIY